GAEEDAERERGAGSDGVGRHESCDDRALREASSDEARCVEKPARDEERRRDEEGKELRSTQGVRRVRREETQRDDDGEREEEPVPLPEAARSRQAVVRVRTAVRHSTSPRASRRALFRSDSSRVLPTSRRGGGE